MDPSNAGIFIEFPSGSLHQTPSNPFGFTTDPTFPAASLSSSSVSSNNLINTSTSISLVELGKRLLGACRDGDDDQVRNLMTKGAPFTTDWLGTSPLHLSALHGHLSTCEILLRAGISRDARTKVDKTPLHFASQDGHTDIVETLLKNGADVDAIDMLRMTPLHWAVERGNVNTVEMLLRYGASVNIESKFDKTPLEIASDNGRPDIFEMLQNADQFRTLAMDPSESDAVTVAATRSIMAEDVMDSDNNHHHQEVPAASQQEIVETGRNSESEALKLLEAQGITLLPEDSGGLTLGDGQSLELTEAGKLAFGITKPKTTTTTTTTTTANNNPTSIAVSNITKIRKIVPSSTASTSQPTSNITKVVSLKSSSISTNASRTITTNNSGKPTKTRVITLTPQQFAAIKSGNGGNIANIISNNVGEKRKILPSSMIGDSRKIKIVPIKLNNSSKQVISTSPTTSSITTIASTKSSSTRILSESESLKRQLEEAQKAAETYKAELRRKEEEANRLKEQLESLYEASQRC